MPLKRCAVCVVLCVCVVTLGGVALRWVSGNGSTCTKKKGRKERKKKKGKKKSVVINKKGGIVCE